MVSVKYCDPCSTFGQSEQYKQVYAVTFERQNYEQEEPGAFGPNKYWVVVFDKYANVLFSTYSPVLLGESAAVNNSIASPCFV